MCTRDDLDKITIAVRDEALRIFAGKLNSVILYGSYARGDNDSESDIDLMLLIDITAETFNGYRSEIAKISSRLSLETDDCVTISVALQDLKTFEKYKEILPYYRNVVSEGIAIYAA